MKTLAFTAISDGIMGGRKCQRKAGCTVFNLFGEGGSNYRAPQKTDEPWPCAVWRKMRGDLWEMRLEIWEIVLYTGVKS
jgi:hypothetical protein